MPLEKNNYQSAPYRVCIELFVTKINEGNIINYFSRIVISKYAKKTNL